MTCLHEVHASIDGAQLAERHGERNKNGNVASWLLAAYNHTHRKLPLSPGKADFGVRFFFGCMSYMSQTHKIPMQISSNQVRVQYLLTELLPAEPPPPPLPHGCLFDTCGCALGNTSPTKGEAVSSDPYTGG